MLSATFIIAGTLLILGWLITKFNLVEIVAGYDVTKVTDKKGLARWVGLHLAGMGTLGLVAGILGLLLPAIAILLAGIFYFSIPILSIKTALGTKRFEK